MYSAKSTIKIAV